MFIGVRDVNGRIHTINAQEVVIVSDADRIDGGYGSGQGAFIVLKNGTTIAVYEEIAEKFREGLRKATKEE